MIQSIYKPQNVAEFEASKLNFIGTGVSGTAAPGVKTNIDFTLVDDCLLTGMTLNCQGQTFGDSVSFLVLDLEGKAKLWSESNQVWFSVPAGTVLNMFVKDWRLTQDWQKQVDEDLSYPAKIYGGLTLRLIYNSVAAVGLTPVNVGVNYVLHKVLL